MSTYFEDGATWVEVEEFTDPDGNECVGFECPECGHWGIVSEARFGSINTEGGLSVERPVACRKPGCDWSGIIYQGEVAA